MLRQLLSFAAVSGGLVQAWTSTSFSTTTAIECSTEYGSGSSQPTPLPFSTDATGVTVSSELPAVTTTFTPHTTVGTVTTTGYTATSWVFTVETVTSSVYTTVQRIDSTIATAVIPITVCTNGVVPTTVTEYTGTYTPVSGQPTALPATYPTLVTCQQRATTFLGLIPIETVTASETATVTATTGVLEPTTIVTSTYVVATSTVYASTFTRVTTSYAVGHTEATTSIACESTTTTTYEAKCAPTNLISSIDGVGLVSHSYADNITVTYGPDKDLPYQYDVSQCCQLCLDNAGCAGVMGGVGRCGLLYVGGPNPEPECGYVFTYGTQAGRIPGSGIIVQSGCGSIDYTG